MQRLISVWSWNFCFHFLKDSRIERKNFKCSNVGKFLTFKTKKKCPKQVQFYYLKNSAVFTNIKQNGYKCTDTVLRAIQSIYANISFIYWIAFILLNKLSKMNFNGIQRFSAVGRPVVSYLLIFFFKKNQI